jgi:hypothetical protein
MPGTAAKVFFTEVAESERPISHSTHQEIAERFERSHQAFHRALKHDNGPSLQMDPRRKAALQAGKVGSNGRIASPFNAKSKPRH